MKKKTVILLAVLILAAVCLFNSVYTVEENEYGCTVRLTKIISTTDEPGLHFKIPFIERVAKKVSLKEQCRFWTA